MPKHNSDIAPAPVAGVQKNATARADSELRQSLCAALPQFFDRDGVFLRDKFDVALHAAGIAESSGSANILVGGKPNGAPSGAALDLTKRQRGILERLDTGRDYKDIAQEYGISHKTVGSTVSVLRKLLGPARVPLLRRDMARPATRF